MILPVYRRILDADVRGFTLDPALRMQTCEDEEAQRDDLGNQASEENLLAQRDATGLAGGGQYRADELACNAADVDEDVDCSQPAGTDQRVTAGIEGGEDAPETHVDGGGEEGRRAEEEEVLDDEGAGGVRGVGCSSAAIVAECFAFGRVLEYAGMIGVGRRAHRCRRE
ncbi:hypothetical protein V502_01564 [Pseudogymnoascus sp. VKM F-4520 (FW-2644)]|nr:hypothetical protein V502_01564 [Pseudogymnoascus sp. VKM F-4520 (FW-2644)]